jgi:hypothetical protein
MIAAARSILSSSLLPPSQTRRWLKPVTHTANNYASVGAPWEIRRFSMPNGALFDLYDKDGDIGEYNSQMILSPSHKLAITIMAAGPSGINLRTAIADALANTILPAVENAARAEARANYAGTYRDPASNSSLTISTDTNPGLAVSDFVSRGVPSIAVLGEALGVPGDIHPRLYPTTLETLSKRALGEPGTYTSRTGWRSVFLGPSNTTQGDQFLNPCLAWTGVGLPMYGGVGLDEFVFNLGEDGKATSIDVRGFKLHLSRER